MCKLNTNLKLFPRIYLSQNECLIYIGNQCTVGGPRLLLKYIVVAVEAIDASNYT